MTGRQSGVFWWAVASVGLMIIGSSGPWARVVFASVSGLEGDGVITLAISVGCAAGLWIFAKGSGGALVATATGGLLAMGIGIYDASRIETLASSEILGQEVRAGTVGWGLGLLIAASGSLALASLLLYFARGPQPRRRPGTQAKATFAARRARPRSAQTDPSSTARPEQPDAEATRAAGWYRNYLGSSQFRYWDGQRWTEHTSDDATSDPPAGSAGEP